MRWVLILLSLVFCLVIGLLITINIMPTQWLSDRAETYASTAWGVPVTLEKIDIRILSSHPKFSVANVSVKDDASNELLSNADVDISLDTAELLSGNLSYRNISIKDANLNIMVNSDGVHNWQSLTQQFDTTTAPDNGAHKAIPSIEHLELHNLTMRYQNRQLNHALSLSINASGSTLDASTPTEVTAEGELNGLAINVQSQLASLQEIVSNENKLSLDTSIQVGDTQASIKGSIGDPVAVRDLDLSFQLAAPDVQDLEVLANVPLPILPPFDFSGGLLRDGDDIVLRRFSGVLGDSDVQGDVRADLTTSPPTLYANIISRALDLDDLAGLVGSKPDADETAATEQPKDELIRSGILPSAKLNLEPLMQSFNGAIRFSAQSVISDLYPVDYISARLEVDGSNLSISPIRIGVSDGELSGSLDLDVAQTPNAGTIDLRIQRMDLNKVLTKLGISGGGAGLIGGRAKYWIAGDSIASFAASADGGLFLLMTAGELSALMVELSAIDLVESALLMLDPGKTLTEISCAYLDLHTAGGLSKINTFVLDTNDTVFLADGTIDLDTESFDITLEPHPKDASLIDLSTSVIVSGTPGDISITPGMELPLRAIAAATLAAVATPVAALIPLLDTNEARDSPYCNGLIDGLDQAR